MPDVVHRLSLFESQAPLDWRELEQAIRALQASRAKAVHFVGPEPTQSPHLLLALRACRDASITVVLETDAHALDSEARLALLREAGLERTRVWFHGAAAATHDTLLGKEAFVRSLRGLRRLRQAGFVVDLGFWLGQRTWRELADGIRLAHALGTNSFTAAPARDEAPLSSDALLDALISGFQASATQGIRLGLEGWQRISADELLRRSGQTVNVAVWGLLELGLLDRPRLPLYAASERGDHESFELAARTAGSVSELCHGLSAWRSPLVDLPPCVGGYGARRPARAATASTKSAQCGGCPADPACEGVDASLGSDVAALLTPLPGWRSVTPNRVELVGFEASASFERRETYPGLADELSRLGVETAFVAGAGGAVEGHGADSTDTIPALRIFNDYASLARNLPALRRDGSRALLFDFHLLHGLAELQAACGFAEGRGSARSPRNGNWWPKNVTVVSCFPGYAKLYLRAGIPLERITWRPYPIHLPTSPEALPVLEATSIACGGNHLRDWATFEAATRALPAGRLIDAFGAPDSLPSGPRTRNRGYVETADFWSALARSRFVLLPLESDWRRPAGITVMAMALAVGRPIVCSRIQAAEDHLRDDEDSILVPPGDAGALAAAIRRLDEDDALCERLAAGARKNRAQLTTASLANLIVRGVEPPELAPRRADLGPLANW